MADLNDILTNLRSELVAKILQIPVEEKGTGEVSFHYHLPSKGSFEEATGRPRLFAVRISKCVAKWCGVGNRRYDVTLEISVGYPLHDWDVAMASDYDQMRETINAHGGASSVTGVGFRWVDMDGYKIEPHEDWQHAVTSVNAVVETA